MAAGLATLRETERPGFYDALEQRTARLVAGIGDAARRHGVPASGGHAGSLWGVFFTGGARGEFPQAEGSCVGLFSRWHPAAPPGGGFLAPPALQAGGFSPSRTGVEIPFSH